MPHKRSQPQDINKLNETITQLRDELDSLRSTVNLLLEMIMEQDDGDYEEGAPHNPWDAIVSNPQGFLRMGM